jgi:hypothetical protein
VNQPPSSPLETGLVWIASFVIAFMTVATAICTLGVMIVMLIWIPFVNVLSPLFGLAAALYVVRMMRRALWPPPAVGSEGITWLDE